VGRECERPLTFVGGTGRRRSVQESYESIIIAVWRLTSEFGSRLECFVDCRAQNSAGTCSTIASAKRAATNRVTRLHTRYKYLDHDGIGVQSDGQGFVYIRQQASTHRICALANCAIHNHHQLHHKGGAQGRIANHKSEHVNRFETV
jgi:hypothetical protein